MKKKVRSKCGKRILQFIMFLTLGITTYILLFIGGANTFIDDMCFIIFFVESILLIVRQCLIDYWYFKDNGFFKKISFPKIKSNK